MAMQNCNSQHSLNIKYISFLTAIWGGDLLDRGILTVSLAPRDNHEAQVQFALERGIPAILGVISTQRLPFPSNSFDMAHCSRCLIPWTEGFGMPEKAMAFILQQ
ncbi:putative methyltransferase PMT21, partial [Mucuna pruriens]